MLGLFVGVYGWDTPFDAMKSTGSVLPYSSQIIPSVVFDLVSYISRQVSQ